LIKSKLIDRMKDHARQWGATVDNPIETESSVIAFGRRDTGTCEGQPVVLKIVKREGDEWRSGEILKAFGGVGVARVYEYTPGAVLLERLMPGNSLADTSLSGKDAEATNILATVIQQMSAAMSMSDDEASEAGATVVTVWDWGKAFEHYLATEDNQVPRQLVESAQRLYFQLCASQRKPRLLHGDLQHYNVLFDSERGWLAIDPKGVVGEVEYEIGAMLRNPVERPEMFSLPATIEKRIKELSGVLNVDGERVLAWGFAQAVLSAVWGVDDGFPVDAMNPALRLASAIKPMLRGIAEAQ
jgi:streptomycin 6-kinase